MRFSAASPIKGNIREIPGNIPIGTWWNKVNEYQAEYEAGVGFDLAFFDPVMEFLAPHRLARLKAQVRVWLEVTGEYPQDVACWWPVRNGRRAGEVPHGTWTAESVIDESGVLHCGFCRARWSPHRDGSRHDERCSLCDRIHVITEDRSERQWL